jgi:hypothetical protein
MASLSTVTSIVAKHPKAAAKALKKLGHGEDTVLAHLEPWEARMLDRKTDGQTINTRTGLPAFENDGGGSTAGGGGGEGGDNGVGGPGNGSDGTGPGQGESTGSSPGSTADTGGFGFGSSTGQFSDTYGANVGFGFSAPTEAPDTGGKFGPNGGGLTMNDIAGGFTPGGPTGTIGPNGDMSNFASPVGSLTSAFGGSEDMGHPAPAKPYDPLSSPVTAAPERPGVRKDVDAFNNTVGKATSLRQEVGVNPATKTLDRHNFMDINPVSLGLGFVTGMPIGHLMDLANIKDPLGFSVDMGYGTNVSTNPDRDGDGYSDSAGDSSDVDRRLDEGLKSFMKPPATALTNPGTLAPVTPSTPGSSYVPPTSPLASVTPVAQTKLRARRGLMGDYAPNFRTSAV